MNGPVPGSAEKYTVESPDAQMFLPVHYHQGRWIVDDVLVEYMRTQLSLDITDMVRVGDKVTYVARKPLFVVDLGICTWLGAEHGELRLKHEVVHNSLL